MDFKFVILLIIAVAIVFLIISELNVLRSDMDKRFNDIDTLIDKHNEDIKMTIKKDINSIGTIYKSYTSDMVHQFRTMNSIEKQHVMMMSDNFAEEDSHNEYTCNIPYLSEGNVQLNESSESNLYKSAGSKTSSSSNQKTNDQFKVRDQFDNLLKINNMSDNVINILSSVDPLESKSESRVLPTTVRESVREPVLEPVLEPVIEPVLEPVIEPVPDPFIVSKKADNVSDNMTDVAPIRSDDDQETATLESDKKRDDLTNQCVDDISMGTLDKKIKLKSCNQYRKSDIEAIAKKNKIIYSAKMNKLDLYNLIKQNMNRPDFVT